VTVSGNTITSEFDLIGDSTVVEFTGHNNYGPSQNEAYHDYAPDTGGNGGNGDDVADDGNGGNGGNGGPQPPGGTPGFETLFALIAISIAVILMKRRK